MLNAPGRDEFCKACHSETIAVQGSMLDGHKLKLQLSTKKGVTVPSKPAKAKNDQHAKSTKIVVRNVAFEATAKEIRALFQPFGQIKSVRLPKKLQNSHRQVPLVYFPLFQFSLRWILKAISLSLKFCNMALYWCLPWPTGRRFGREGKFTIAGPALIAHPIVSLLLNRIFFEGLTGLWSHFYNRLVSPCIISQ